MEKRILCNQGIVTTIIILLIASMLIGGTFLYTKKITPIKKETPTTNQSQTKKQIPQKETEIPLIQTTNNTETTTSVKTNTATTITSKLSPKETYLLFANGIKNSKTLEQALIVGRTYADVEYNEMQKALPISNMTTDQKNKALNFMQAVTPSQSQIQNITEKISNNTAIVSIQAKNISGTISNIKITLVLEKGIWKIHESVVLK